MTTGSTTTNPVALFRAGFTDIVSVIPPKAPLAPSCNISPTKLGKIPGVRQPNGLWAGYRWSTHRPNLDEVERWYADGASIGLLATRFPALDIDCTDEAWAERIEALAVEILGPAPRRIGNPPKRILMYRASESFRRARLTFRLAGKQHLIEFLGDGQQYVVAGTHPATSQPYTWNRDPVDSGVEGLTLLTPENATRFLDQVSSVLEEQGILVRREGGSTPGGTHTIVDQDGLRAPSIERLREAVTLMPNTSEHFPTHYDYICLGIAIKAASQPDGDAGFSLWSDWCARWSDGDNAPEDVIRDWKSLNPPFRIGWDFVASKARHFGFNDASDTFPAIEPTPTTSRGEVAAPYLTDQWLARRIAELLQSRIRHVAMREQWLVWNGHQWSPDTTRSVEDLVAAELRAIADHLSRTGSKGDRARALAICSTGKLKAVLTLLCAHPALAIEQSALDADPWILNTPSGIVDLRSGELTPSEPTALCSRSTAVAPDVSLAAPCFRKFLADTTGGDRGLEAYLQRFAGYALTGSTKEHVLPFVWGPGGNGKSVFINAVAGILGGYHRTAPMETFLESKFDRHPVDLAHLCGARLVTASETQSGRSLDTAKVKLLTGGDPIAARFMRQDFFEFTPAFKILIAGNHKPGLGALDDGMKRRVHLVPFTCKPTNVDHELPAKLREEWPAILAWMVEGCLAWQRDGLNPPACVAAATAEHFEDEDTLERWLKEDCETARAHLALVADLFARWSSWCANAGEPVGSIKAFSQALERHGFKKTRTGPLGSVAFAGLRIRADRSTSELAPLAPAVAVP